LSKEWAKFSYNLSLVGGLGLAVLLPVFFIMWFGYVIESWLNLDKAIRLVFLGLGIAAGLLNAYRMIAIRFR